MPKYPFKHDGPVYLVQDDDFEIAYYSRNKRKLRRVRKKPNETWAMTVEREIDNETFWMVIALVEMRGHHA